jgi:hypothetical protein
MTGAANDPYAKIRAATNAHRGRHGCSAYPYDNGPLLAALAAAANARRILELGTALGYTALSFASGARDATVDTIERDSEHVRLARENIAGASMDHRITVHEGDFAAILPTLDPGYDVAFFDGQTPSPAHWWNVDYRQLESRRYSGSRAQGLVRRQILAQRTARRGRRNGNQREAVSCGHWRPSQAIIGPDSAKPGIRP